MKPYNFKTMKKYQRIISILPAGPGQKIVKIEYRNQILTGYYTCMPVFDRYNSEERGWKTAAAQIYDAVVRQIKPRWK